MVGQAKARKAAGLIVKMVQDSRISGKAILMAGPPSSGKTAIAMGGARFVSSWLAYNLCLIGFLKHTQEWHKA